MELQISTLESQMSTEPTITTPPSASLSEQQQEVADFIAKMKMLAPAASTGRERGRLVFAMDATMSREPTWDLALKMQGDMFRRGQGGWGPRRATRLFPGPR